MARISQSAPPTPGASDLNLLAWLASSVSVFAFLFYYRQGETLLYGDAIAHINIARRVFEFQDFRGFCNLAPFGYLFLTCS